MPMMQWWSRLPQSSLSFSFSTSSRPVSSPSCLHLLCCVCCWVERRYQEATDSEASGVSSSTS